jgi:hypothetical protein
MTGENSNLAQSLVSFEFEGSALLLRSPSGIWIVRDESNRRGGYFRDRASARAFIRSELGGKAD